MTQPDDHRLEWITDHLTVTLRTARTALSRSTAVLLGHEADVGMKAAEQALHELREEIEELMPAVPSGPAPSPDIRTTVAVVHVGGDLERLAQLTQQIAEIAWSRHRGRPLPRHLAPAFGKMSGGVLDMVERAGETALLDSTAAVEAAADLERELDAIAGQQRVLDDVLVSGDPPVDDASAVDLVLLGRCYEGCARHAVSAARHVTLLAS
jgi:phosphate transport system protein